ncbi:hypothetical protein SPSINT_0574 [Staphylococcus pseudintermedius HKU10-03]|nr:hypothetical protein SPSINT_0574 [Staphylococcus pseudintermedius HKU10-03]
MSANLYPSINLNFSILCSNPSNLSITSIIFFCLVFKVCNLSLITLISSTTLSVCLIRDKKSCFLPNLALSLTLTAPQFSISSLQMSFLSFKLSISNLLVLYISINSIIYSRSLCFSFFNILRASIAINVNIKTVLSIKMFGLRVFSAKSKAIAIIVSAEI